MGDESSNAQHRQTASKLSDIPQGPHLQSGHCHKSTRIQREGEDFCSEVGRQQYAGREGRL